MDFIKKLKENTEQPRLMFSKEEYDERVTKVRSLMQEKGLDVLLISNSANMGYLTGYDTSMPSGYSVLILPVEREKEPILHCIGLEAPCMILNGWVRNIYEFDWYKAQDTGADLARVLLENDYDGKTVGIEMGYAESFSIGAFDTKSYLTLREKLPNASLVDATTMVLDVRMIKSPQEIEYMKKAGSLTWEGLKAGLNALEVGKTDSEVIAECYRAPHLGGSQLMSIDPMIMSGERTGYMPHIAYKRDVLKAGDPVYFEMTGTYNRYNAPSMRSAVIGEPTKEVLQLSEASINTVKSLLENIKPGKTGDDVAQIVRKKQAGIDNLFFHGAYGYSIGMGFQPHWTEAPMYISEGEERELKPGMCFHLDICVTAPGSSGVGFSESITVTADGCETLTPNKELELRRVPVK